MLRYLTGCLWLLGGLGTPISAADLYSLNFPSPFGKFNVLADQPYLLRQNEGGPPGNAIDIKEGELIHYRSKKPLTYPLEGDSSVVTLGAPNAGKRWDVEPREKRAVPVRALEGKFAGWFLDWSDDEEELVVEGRTYHVRKLRLVKDPKEPRKFATFPVSK